MIKVLTLGLLSMTINCLANYEMIITAAISSRKRIISPELNAFYCLPKSNISRLKITKYKYIFPTELAAFNFMHELNELNITPALQADPCLTAALSADIVKKLGLPNCFMHSLHIEQIRKLKE